MNQPPQEPDDGQEREAQSSCTRGEPAWRILLVEDCPDHQQLTLSILRSAGAEVTLECNGQAAINRIASMGFDNSCFHVIVTDCRMPILDGVEMTRRLRKLGCTIPIVMCSSEIKPEVQQRALDAGCDSFLSKSVAHEDLVKHVLRFAGNRPKSQKDLTAADRAGNGTSA